MDYIEGGDLFKIIENNGRFTEREAKISFKQILLAISHMHAMNYAHRDIKLENCLVSEDDISKIFLIDFGFAKKFRDENNQQILFNENLGTR